MKKPFDKWALLALLAVGMLVADQLTKFLAVEHLTWLFRAVHAESPGERVRAFVAQRDLLERGLRRDTFVQVLPFWQNLYTQNRAAAFGMLGFVPAALRLPLFYVIAVAAVVFLFRFYRGLQVHQRFLQVAVGLTLGGALGNALDRVLHGYVIDFIDWHWFDPDWLRPQLHWPTFNVADSGISVGLVLLALDALFARRGHGQAAVNAAGARKV